MLYNGRRGVDLRSVHKPVPLSRATRGSATDHRGIKLATCRWLIYSRCACPNTDIGFVHREIWDYPYSEQIVKLVGQVDHQEKSIASLANLKNNYCCYLNNEQDLVKNSRSLGLDHLSQR